MTAEGRNLADRLGPGRGGRGGMQVRGSAGGRQLGNNGPMNKAGMNMGMGMGPGGKSSTRWKSDPCSTRRVGFQPGFQPGMMPPAYGGFFSPGQQEMMAQMMMMQANMAQMGKMMQKMAEVSARFRGV